MESIPLSALQHYAFCPRQCALIHNEQQWAGNLLTAQGDLLHERVDAGEPETRKGIRFERSVHVFSLILGIGGILDLLEINIHSGAMYPVEYKRGRPKKDHWDKVQLCAQALCLEEMRDAIITEGALWYGQTLHRESVVFDDALREETKTIISEVHRLLESGETPPAQYGKHCKSCSIFELCQPQLLSKDRSVIYIANLFSVEVEEA
jgi:CRISPR-associated protein Cas4